MRNAPWGPVVRTPAVRDRMGGMFETYDEKNVHQEDSGYTKGSNPVNSTGNTKNPEATVFRLAAQNKNVGNLKNNCSDKSKILTAVTGNSNVLWSCLKKTDNGKAICNTCSAVIDCKGGTTS